MNNYVHLAIDDVSLPFRKNVGLYLSKPSVRPEAVLKPSPFDSTAPDNLAAHFYGTVLHDAGKYRMWYYACHWGKNPDWPPHLMQQLAKYHGVGANAAPLFGGPLCYAESNDGITWTKPALGQVLFKGNRNNNALALPHTKVCTAIVIKDEEDPDPARRYKMTYQFSPAYAEPLMEEYGKVTTTALAVSPDGLRWTVIGIPFINQFVEPSSFIKHQGRYVIHHHVMGNWAGYCAEGGTPCGRTGVAHATIDFAHWPDLMAEAFALAEPEDRSKRDMYGDYDQVHLGVGASSFGNVCVGLYGLWHNSRDAKSFNEISCDFGLLVSNDGIHFREPVKGHRFLRREDSLVTPVPGHDFNTILCQANGILNVSDETRIYHGRWRNAGFGAAADQNFRHYSGEVALATLPRDRWGALGLNPGANEGAVCSAPMAIPAGGGALTLNADGVAGLTVELLDEQFRPISGFGAGKVTGPDGLDCPITWPGQGFAELKGRAVRIQVRIRRLDDLSPRLYALNTVHSLPVHPAE